MRRIPFYPIVVLLLVAVGGYLGCDPNSIKLPSSPSRPNASSNPQLSMVIPERSEATILVGSFNLQRLGPGKLSDPWVMERFAEIVQLFDLIALQEITSRHQPAVQLLVNKVNESGAQYQFVQSPPIGRTENYLEQYAFIYDSTRIMSGPQYTYVVRDEADLLHREPLVARFATRAPGQPFKFTLINAHTDPDEIGSELNVLADVYVGVRRFEYPEDDVLLLGDLNAPPNGLQKLGSIPAFLPLIVNIPTNTRKTKTLDNILIDSQTTREFTGRAGTVGLERLFGLSEKQALELSDHLPIWAEFTVTEQSISTATLSTSPIYLHGSERWR